MKETFKKLIVNFHERIFSHIAEREYQIPTDT